MILGAIGMQTMEQNAGTKVTVWLHDLQVYILCVEVVTGLHCSYTFMIIYITSYIHGFIIEYNYHFSLLQMVVRVY